MIDPAAEVDWLIQAELDRRIDTARMEAQEQARAKTEADRSGFAAMPPKPEDVEGWTQYGINCDGYSGQLVSTASQEQGQAAAKEKGWPWMTLQERWQESAMHIDEQIAARTTGQGDRLDQPA